MEHTLKQEITSFYQAEEVFDATKEKLSNYFADNDTITLELHSEQDRLGGCDNNIQLAHYINVLSIIQRLSFITKDLSVSDNPKEPINTFGLLSTVLLTYTSLFIEHLYRPRLKVKNGHLLRPNINVFKNKLPDITELITDGNINPDITTYLLTEQTDLIKDYIELLHHNLIETNNIYKTIELKIPFTKKVLWSYSYPRWKYRYLHHIFKKQNTSPLTIFAIKQDIDKNYSHIDCEVVIDKVFNKSIIPSFRKYSKLHNNIDIDNFYRQVKDTYLSRYKHNKRVRTEIILNEKGGD